MSQLNDYYNFDRYMALLPAYPQYFERQEWTTPGMASHAAYVWMVAYESAPDTTEHRERISSLTNHQGNLLPASQWPYESPR